MSPPVPDGAFVVLFKDNSQREVFLVHRSDKPVWNLPGGGIETDESPDKAVIREAFEETGFKIKLIRKAGLYQNIDIKTGDIWNIVYLYTGRVLSGTFRPEFPSCKGEWFSVDRLPSNIQHVTSQRILDALSPTGKPFVKQFKPRQIM